MALKKPQCCARCRQWIGRIVAFLSDKNLDIRRMAVNVLQNIHENIDPSALTSYFVQSSPHDQVLMYEIIAIAIVQTRADTNKKQFL